MSEPRAKARKLIALALGSTNETESRNAALAACVFIQKHKLLADDEDDVPRGFAPSPRRSPPTATVFDELFRVIMEEDRPRPYPPRRAAPPPQPTVEPVPSRKPKRDKSAKQVPVTDFATFCKECRQQIRRGQYATWVNSEMYHSACYDACTEP